MEQGPLDSVEVGDPCRSFVVDQGVQHERIVAFVLRGLQGFRAKENAARASSAR
jgi:hypothetical protein